MVTNFFRIDLPFDTFQIQRLPYSEEKLAELRRTENHQASFFRNGDFIYASPRKGIEKDYGELVSLKVEESTKIVLSLIRHLIFRSFRDTVRGRIPESFAPLRFYSEKVEHDAIRNLLTPELQGKISFSRMIEVHVKNVMARGKPVFGLLVLSRWRWKFEISLDDLFAQGFDLVGSTVLETVPLPGLGGILAPDESLLGQIISISSGRAEIKTNDGIITRELAKLQLQRTREQIGSFLSFKLGAESATNILRVVAEHRRDQGIPNFIYSESQKFASWFSNQKGNPRIYENGDGFCFSVTTNNVFDGPSIPIQRTNLIFDFGPGASSPTPLSGLQRFGPFNSSRFEKNNLKILLIYHYRSRGGITQFLSRLIDGIPESQYFQRGLKALFRLSSVQYVLKEVSDYSPEAFEKCIRDAVAENASEGFDIALVECEDGSKHIRPEENPYYRSRSMLMGCGIPTQGVRDVHLRSPVKSLQFTLGPMALQIYAKVGGTPWRLPATQSVDREIVIGIGHSLERPNLWVGAEQSRVVGITTIFQGDGSYLLGERLRSVPYEEYFSHLLNALKTSIEKVASEYGWALGETVRIVFHIFKPIRNVEADVVQQLVSSFPNFQILFSFVTISTEHPWILFRNAYFRNREWQIALCERGDTLILDEHQCLLQIRGDRDRPNRRQRPPYPVLVRVHERSTFKDLQYIVQQIHDFAFMSWRSFFPCEEPITIFYSTLIAEESTKLNRIPGWNPAFLDTHFRRKQWFL